MDKRKVERINFLAKKSKTPQGLTDAEKEEQAALRKEYIASWKRSLTAELENTYVLMPDGTKRKLKKKD